MSSSVRPNSKTQHKSIPKNATTLTRHHDHGLAATYNHDSRTSEDIKQAHRLIQYVQETLILHILHTDMQCRSHDGTTAAQAIWTAVKAVTHRPSEIAWHAATLEEMRPKKVTHNVYLN